IHFIPGAPGVDALPLDALIGPCLIVEIPGEHHISTEDLKRSALGPGVERVLFKTGNSRLWRDPKFRRDFRALQVDAASWLVEHGTRLVGIDYLSVEPYAADPPAVHLAL